VLIRAWRMKRDTYPRRRGFEIDRARVGNSFFLFGATPKNLSPGSALPSNP
jgi:hypothetical protein